MGFEREIIRQLEPYVPGEQPDPLTHPQVVKLNTNENPYPPSPGVLNALRAVDGELLRRYPSPTARRFRERAAQIHGLAPEQVIATNGGDELLRLAVTVFCDPLNNGRVETKRCGLAVGEPSYSLFDVLAGIQATPLVKVPLNDDFSLPNDFAEQLNRTGTQLALIVNPHAPSGRLQPTEQLAQIAEQFEGVLLIDEAYVDFATHDALPLLDPGRGLKNVLLLRTMSKGYALAGLRFGYGLGDPGLIAALDKVRDSYNTDILAQVAAVAALESRHEAARSWQAVYEQRERVAAELGALGFTVLPSQANFVLASPPPDGPDAMNLYESLKGKRILVRYFDQERLRNKLRITIGTPLQNDTLLTAVNELLTG